MDDEEDDSASDAWGSTLDGKKSVQPGVNKEMLRKALQLNPKLREAVTTGDVMNQLEKAGQQRPTAAAAAPASGAQSDDLEEAILQQRDRYLEAKKQILAERAALEAREKQLVPQTLVRVLDVMLRLDKNLTSPVTLELLKSELAFFTEIGFSAKKLSERKAQLK